MASVTNLIQLIKSDGGNGPVKSQQPLQRDSCKSVLRNGAVTTVTYYNGTYVCTYTASTGSYSTPTKTGAAAQNNTVTIA